ncbi:MAG: CCA tRNA nucleotidyltransferase [Limnochordaceae bacterium]|nr:CCA tRNA nucleotidyltransferase [Limnochordaceae bacterium]
MIAGEETGVLPPPLHSSTDGSFGGALAPLPPQVQDVLRRLHAAGYKAHLVGGCVRDRLLGRPPHDWDVATNARPEQVLPLFVHCVPTGVAYGTVTVFAGEPDRHEPVQVTTYRKEMGSRDLRHPEKVVFSDSVEEDLARRDFTINAIAYDPWAEVLVDPVHGRQDLERRLIRAVGNPDQRFDEDALRLLRAVRLATELRPYHFRLESKTRTAIRRHAPQVEYLSRERIRDEFLRLLAAPDPQWGLWELQDLDLLFRIIPELAATHHFPQDKPGVPTLLDHLIRAVQNVPPDPILRLAALLHDIAKPATATMSPDGQVHFYCHDTLGAEMASRIAASLRLPRSQADRLASLIRMHMVDGTDVGKKALRRWLGQYGERWIRDLLALRRADNIASGVSPDEPNPFIDRLEDLLDEVLHEQKAFRTQDLCLDGRQVMAELGVGPGPMVGAALRYLLEQVLDDPSLNTPDQLRRLLHDWWQRTRSSPVPAVHRRQRGPASTSPPPGLPD